MSRDHVRKLGMQERQRLDPKWYTVSQVAQLLGYGETKARMLIISVSAAVDTLAISDR